MLLKINIAIMLTLFSGYALSGGEEGGGTAGGNGGGPKLRAIASIVEVDESIIQKDLFAATNVCLARLKSEFRANVVDKNSLDLAFKKIEAEILNQKSKGVLVDSIHFPECIYVANETNNPILKKHLTSIRDDSEKENIPVSSSISK